MSGPSAANARKIESKAQLVAYLEEAAKPQDDWRIGTEHEKFAYDLKDFRRLPYDGEPGIRQLLESLSAYGWTPVHEGDNIIALKDKTGASVSLEPGGQVELSGAPLETIHQTCAEVNRHLKQVKEICGRIGAGMIGLGFDPQWTREDIRWMPKGRYDIMKAYMPTRGSMGIDMMIRTCTVQVNLDYSGETDMVRKVRTSLALQPIATALFANSPFKEGKDTGFESLRSNVWTDTDPDRCGMLPFVFEEGFGYERWIDYMLDVPMYFVYRDGHYHNVAGKSFRDFMNGTLEGFEGELPTLSDWEDHMTTAFPEVRVKKYIEMRGADGGPWRNLCALPAFWVGLLYDAQALDAAEALVSDWSVADMSALRDAVPQQGLKAEINGRSVRDISRDALKIAADGLRRRNRLNWDGETEEHYLNPLHTIVETGKTSAHILRERFEGDWNGDITQIYREFCY